MKMFTSTKSLRGPAVLFAFCALLLNGASLFADDARPDDNVFVSSPLLPVSLRRVVLLPLAHEGSQAELSSGCEMLYPVLQAELIKTKKFEVVTASPKTTQALTGQAAWTGAEVLPPDFFGSLQRVYGCDAVLFCQLTAFHSYPPLMIGWRMKLVDVSTQKIIWSADVVYDASDLAVTKSAQEFQKQQEGADKPKTFFRRVWTWLDRRSEPATDEPWTVLNSPRYFGQFSSAKLLQTLPER
jgi:hypothetical protein